MDSGDAATTEASPTVLAYGSINRTRRRRNRLVAALVAVLLVALGYGWHRWGEDIKSRYAAWQQSRANARQLAQCMDFTAPPERVVYEEDPIRAKSLLTLPEIHTIAVNYTTYTNSLSEGTLPFEMQVPVARTPALWLALARRAHLAPVDEGTALLFMHGRTSANGMRRLVCVGADFDVRQEFAGRDDPPAWGVVRQIRAWTLPADPEHISLDYAFDVGYIYIRSECERDVVSRFTQDTAPRIGSPFPIRFFAGQPDPADASRFTIAYQLDGIDHRGLISGVLRDNGEVWFSPDMGRFDGEGPVTHWYLNSSFEASTKPALAK